MTNFNAKELTNAYHEIITLETTKGNISDDIKATYAQLKSKGHDVVALRKVVADKKKELKKVLETESMVSIYRDALGIVTTNKGE
jgi:uncharacterized protein (UPF0335 family)